MSRPLHTARPLKRIATLSLIVIITPIPLAGARQSPPASQQQPPRKVLARPGKNVETPEDKKQSAPEDKGSAGDEDVVRVDTDVASVLLTAVDKEGRFVTNLRREDLRVLENGVPQDVSTFERETDLPLSLAVLVDTSRSLELVLDDEKKAAVEFVDSVIRPEKDRAAVVSFTGEAVVEQELTGEKPALRAAIARVKIAEPKTEEEDSPADSDPGLEVRYSTAI
ncbi:MAG TPA: VWA domain-containing protein, partial [Pyrinomonadaceae bacterium]